MSTTKRAVVVLACALALPGGDGVLAQRPDSAPRPAPAQPAGPQVQPTPGIPPVTFRVEVSYVEVDVIVTDRNGNLVRDLRKEDFTVLEDGVPQQVDLFTVVDIPIERADRVVPDRPPVEPDVRFNDRFEGRMFVIVLDDLHTHPLRSPLVTRAARQFIERHLGANDLAAVVTSSGSTTAAQEFTSNKRLLLEAVGRFMGQKTRSRALNRMDEYYRLRDLPRDNPLTRSDIKDPDDQIRAYQARSAMDTLRNVARYLEGVRGRRKAVLFISEGIDYDIHDVFENREATSVLDAVRDAIGAATRGNVAFYAIDPRGLTSLGDEGIEMTGFAEDPGLGVGPQAFRDELRLAQDSLRTLAEQTGGFAVVDTNDFRGAFERVVRENSTYYVLGYYPQNQRRDGRFRRIEVRVNRPDLEVRARKGYVAPRGRNETRTTEAAAGTSAVLREALSSPIPEPGLPMAVQAVPFKGPAPKASVLVITQFGGRALRFTEENGEFRNTIELSMLAIDAQGKVRNGDRNTVDLRLKPQTHQAVVAGGFRMLSRLELPPGRYQLRVAATESGGQVGSVLYDLEVPDFAGEGLSMSGLVLTSRAAALTPTARPDEELKSVLEGPPSILRDFFQADTIRLFTEIYDSKTAVPHRVDITTTLVGEDGRVVFKTEDVRSSDELQGARGGYGYVAQVPLREVRPGRYLLRVEARSRLQSDKPVARETEIRVHPVPAPSPPSPASAPQARLVVPVDRGPMSGVTTAEQVVARTQEEWEALWKRLPARRAMPRVTFANTMIAAVFLGERPSTGYSADIVGVSLDGDTLRIEYTEHQPADGSVAGQLVTTPYVVAGVPMHQGPVTFVKVPPSGREP